MQAFDDDRELFAICERLAAGLTDAAQEHGYGQLAVHLPSSTAAWWEYTPRDLGHDVLCLTVPSDSEGESLGDLYARCLRVVEEEVENYEVRLRRRKALGFPWRNSDGYTE